MLDDEQLKNINQVDLLREQLFYEIEKYSSVFIQKIRNGDDINKPVREKYERPKFMCYKCTIRELFDNVEMYKINFGDCDVCLRGIEKNAVNLLDLKYQTDNICMAAVKSEGHLLYNVKNKTYEICLAALNQSVDAISHVPHEFFMNKELCMAAVKWYTGDHRLGYMKIAFEKINKIYDNNLYVKKRKDLFFSMVKFNGMLIKFINTKFHSLELYTEAIKQNGLALNYVNLDFDKDNITCSDIEIIINMYSLAVKQNAMALEYTNGDFIKTVEREKGSCECKHFEKLQNIFMASVEQNGLALCYFRCIDENNKR